MGHVIEKILPQVQSGVRIEIDGSAARDVVIGTVGLDLAGLQIENGGAKLDYRAAIRSCLWAE